MTLLSVLTVIAVVLIFATGEFSNSPDNLKKQLEDVFAQSDNDDFERKKELFDKKNERRKSLVDLYLDKCLTKEEFKEKAMSMDREIERQEEALGAFSKYKFEKNEVKTVVNKCLKYAYDFIKSSEISDEFIKAILEETENLTTTKRLLFIRTIISTKKGCPQWTPLSLFQFHSSHHTAQDNQRMSRYYHHTH